MSASVLQPLYDDGSIPIGHLVFVQSLLEKGNCVCGQDLILDSEYRQHVQHMVEKSSGKEGKGELPSPSAACCEYAASTQGR